MRGKIGILVVDDHAMFREGLKAIIEADVRFKVVGETGSGKEAIALTKKLGPKIVIIDISLPDQSGIQLCREIRNQYPSVAILMVSMHSKMGYVSQAIHAGANGYLVKDSGSDMLLKGLEAVSKGEVFVDRSLSYGLLKKMFEENSKHLNLDDAAYTELTGREQEIFRMLAEGMTTREIAEHLYISLKTVENHRTRILKKLDLHSELDLVRYAARIGIIDVDDWNE